MPGLLGRVTWNIGFKIIQTVTFAMLLNMVVTQAAKKEKQTAKEPVWVPNCYNSLAVPVVHISL